MHPRFDNPLRRWWGLFAALVVVPFLSSEARASCGDYVHIQEHGQAGKQKPLDGPQCSRHEQPLPAAPAAPPTTNVTESACFVLEPLLFDLSTGFHTSESPLFAAPDAGCRLERPPRS